MALIWKYSLLLVCDMDMYGKSKTVVSCSMYCLFAVFSLLLCSANAVFLRLSVVSFFCIGSEFQYWNEDYEILIKFPPRDGS